jgi:hypothetical protein
MALFVGEERLTPVLRLALSTLVSSIRYFLAYPIIISNPENSNMLQTEAKFLVPDWGISSILA